jgi:hypothetical protein
LRDRLTNAAAFQQYLHTRPLMRFMGSFPACRILAHVCNLVLQVSCLTRAIHRWAVLLRNCCTPSRTASLGFRFLVNRVFWERKWSERLDLT